MLSLVMQCITLIGAMTALLSGACWMLAARVAPVVPMGYVSGPPDEVMKRIQETAKWNSWAAWLASASGVCQFVALLGFSTHS